MTIRAQCQRVSNPFWAFLSLWKSRPVKVVLRGRFTFLRLSFAVEGKSLNGSGGAINSPVPPTRISGHALDLKGQFP